MEKTYIKTNKNLSVNEIKVLKTLLDKFFNLDYNVKIEDDTEFYYLCQKIISNQQKILSDFDMSGRLIWKNDHVEKVN